jgi:hypothetical protein
MAKGSFIRAIQLFRETAWGWQSKGSLGEEFKSALIRG